MPDSAKTPEWRAKIKQELIGITLIFLAVALFLALFSFDAYDSVPPLQTPGGRPAHSRRP